MQASVCVCGYACPVCVNACSRWVQVLCALCVTRALCVCHTVFTVAVAEGFNLQPAKTNIGLLQSPLIILSDPSQLNYL